MNAKSKQTAYLSFVGKLQSGAVDTLITTCTQLAGDNVDEVYLTISTPGGSVSPTIAAYNLLRGLPFHLITHNVGNVDSMGNVLFLAGAERYASPHSTFMFHGVGFSVTNRMRFEMKNLREKVDSVEADQAKIAGILVDQTQLGKAAVDELFREAITRDTQFALDHGIVHAVRDLAIPKGAKLQHIGAKN